MHRVEGCRACSGAAGTESVGLGLGLRLGLWTRASPALGRHPIGGLGLRPPITSWGVLLAEAQNINVVALYPWLMLPVVPVIVTILAFNFFGDGLRDAADPYK